MIIVSRRTRHRNLERSRSVVVGESVCSPSSAKEVLKYSACFSHSFRSEIRVKMMELVDVTYPCPNLVRFVLVMAPAPFRDARGALQRSLRQGLRLRTLLCELASKPIFKWWVTSP